MRIHLSVFDQVGFLGWESRIDLLHHAGPLRADDRSQGAGNTAPRARAASLNRRQRFSNIAIVSALLVSAVAAVGVLFAPEILTIEDPIERADAIVLLGGGDEGDRLFRVAELFQDSRAPVIVVSGSGDCQLNMTHLGMMGVPAAVLIAECSSRTTGENAKLVAPILKGRSVKKAILVTSWFHSRRAAAIFRHGIPDVGWIVSPAHHSKDIKDAPSLAMSSLILIEYAKIMWYALRYGIVPF